MQTKTNKILLLFYLVLFSIGVKAQYYNWSKSLSGKGTSTLNNLSPGTSQCKGIAVDKTNNVYITGFCNDSVDYDPDTDTLFLVGGNDDIFFAKYNRDGNLIWAHVIKSNGWNYPTDIKLDNMDNLIITGYCNSSADFDTGQELSLLSVVPGNANFFFIAKYDSSGNFIWAKSTGGAFGVQSHALSLDKNNNVYITGSFYGTLDIDPGPDTFNLQSDGTGVFFAKFDKDGNYVWAKCLSGVGQYGGGSTIECSEKSNIFITGFFGKTVDFNPDTSTYIITSSTTADRFFAKYDYEGNFIWARSINVNDSGAFSTFRSAKIAVDKNENLILTGNFKDKVDFDPGTGQSILLSYNQTSNFICKYDSLGNLIWVKGIIGTYCVASDIALDSAHSIYLTGCFIKADFDPSSKVHFLTSNAPSAFMNFLAKYDENGNYEWAKMLGNNGYGGSTINSVIALNQNNQFIGGGFKQSGDFDPDSNNAILTATGAGQNAFFVKYSSEKTTGIITDRYHTDIIVFPNPFHQQSILILNNPRNEKHVLTLYDLQGRIVKTITNIRTDRVEIKRKDLISGLYFFQLSSGSQIVATGKLIIE